MARATMRPSAWNFAPRPPSLNHEAALQFPRKYNVAFHGAIGTGDAAGAV
jgi:hypothetical protein